MVAGDEDDHGRCNNQLENKMMMTSDRFKIKRDLGSEHYQFTIVSSRF
jgi:hypothetical protein